MKNREIKFRAWDNVDYMSSPFTLQDIQDKKIQFTSDCIVMRFTGRYDSQINGNEVWESDIIENCDTKKLQVVYWNEDESAWYCRYINDETHVVSLADSIGNLNKVIGNIYENPELLQP